MYRFLAPRLCTVLLPLHLAWAAGAEAQEAEAPDTAEVAIGERLFLETRFAQFHFANGTGGDPVVDQTATIGELLPGPFAGQSINCRACHLVDEQVDAPGGGIRTYNDFARRSPVPLRDGDGLTTAVRNAPPLVNSALLRRGGPLFHFDGEFESLEALVEGTLTGRNYGWLPGERTQALAHIARIVRNDDGGGELAREFGGAYRIVLAGTDPAIPPELVLPPAFRIDVEQAADEEILDAVSRLIAAYVEDLRFAQDERGVFSGSPYDAFLARNGLPRAPRRGESPAAYTRRLARALERLNEPTFVTEADGAFAFHDQAFVFGPTELEGMRIFFRQPDFRQRLGLGPTSGGTGNCIACHTAPAFTDFGLHNTGITQLEYDAVHGEGAFARLPVPELAVRNADPNTWLPATERHPEAAEPFRRLPSAEVPTHTDLGVWNLYANADFPGPQQRLQRLLCTAQRAEAPLLLARELRKLDLGGLRRLRSCQPAELLNASIARFKTPGLRDLGHSAPYLHTGNLDTLAGVVQFYREVSALARDGRLRNGAAELNDLHLDTEDVEPLVAFLKALNEDYE